MLRPSKHSHPDQTVINASLVLLEQLKKVRAEKFDGLLGVLKKKVQGGQPLFLPAMNFLFLLGLIKYHPKTDMFEYTKDNETQ